MPPKADGAHARRHKLNRPEYDPVSTPDSPPQRMIYPFRWLAASFARHNFNIILIAHDDYPHDLGSSIQYTVHLPPPFMSGLHFPGATRRIAITGNADPGLESGSQSVHYSIWRQVACLTRSGLSHRYNYMLGLKTDRGEPTDASS
jgi:hypothetical protein